MAWPDTFYVTYDYDQTGAVTHIRENGASSGAGVLATYAYDNLGRMASLTRGNGVVTTGSYDAASRLTELVHNPAGTTHDQTVGFTYNAAGQIVFVCPMRALAFRATGTSPPHSPPTRFNQARASQKRPPAPSLAHALHLFFSAIPPQLRLRPPVTTCAARLAASPPIPHPQRPPPPAHQPARRADTVP